MIVRRRSVIMSDGDGPVLMVYQGARARCWAASVEVPTGTPAETPDPVVPVSVAPSA